ncbi:MAG TPA: arsenate reductase (glutaredoxin) [Gammaproteobacteria bacterium]
MKARIYHNPRCSKSRATLALLEERGVDTEVIEYLKTPPTRKELEKLLKKLGMRASELIRKGEKEWKDSGKDASASEAELIDLMLSHPILIERPIVEVGERARVGRPPERVLELFE